MRRLTADMLRLSPHPIILHVKPVARSNVYSHWVLFLGMEDGRARILDPPRAAEVVPLADVLARWDGTGIVVSEQAASTGQFVWIARGTFAALAAIGIGAVWLVRRHPAATARRSVRRDMVAAASVLGVSAAVALAWHWGSPEGFLSNRSAVASVVANFHSAFVPHLSAEELRTLLEEGETVVVDTRRPQDYRRGHIDGAINVPVSSSLTERERALGHVAKSSRIVVYCQSEGCTWANELANVLAASGYENLAIFPGGWREWSRAVEAAEKGQ
jgi:rhodanese-related sulfurtransferase